MLRLVFFVLVLSFTAQADDKGLASLCFDFSKKVQAPLMKPIPMPGGKDAFQDGKLPSGVEWAAARGTVNVPARVLYEWLLDHAHWKDVSKTQLTLQKMPNPHFLEFHSLKVDARIFALMTLHWTEQWAYGLLKGTPNHPKSLLVSYQKVAGTRYITRLCGSVWLQSVQPNKTDVFLYEEAKADHYEAKNMHEMHIANLQHMRNLAKSAPH